MIKHTPGEWEIGAETIDDQIEIRKYAAAPDLLEACKAALEAIKFLGRTCNDGTNGPCGLCTPCRINKAVPLIKAAIAKATGEAPR